MMLRPAPAVMVFTARNLDAYHEVLYKRLDKLLNTTQPRKSVMLAIDGPAPLAKLMTQRERRKVGVGRGCWRTLGSTECMQYSLRLWTVGCGRSCQGRVLPAVQDLWGEL
jgi:hypothetical protein